MIEAALKTVKLTRPEIIVSTSENINSTNIVFVKEEVRSTCLELLTYHTRKHSKGGREACNGQWYKRCNSRAHKALLQTFFQPYDNQQTKNEISKILKQNCPLKICSTGIFIETKKRRIPLSRHNWQTLLFKEKW